MNFEILNIEVNDTCAVGYTDYIVPCDDNGIAYGGADPEITQKILAVEYYAEFDSARFMWFLADEDGFVFDSEDAEEIDVDITPYEDELREAWQEEYGE